MLFILCLFNSIGNVMNELYFFSIVFIFYLDVKCLLLFLMCITIFVFRVGVSSFFVVFLIVNFLFLVEFYFYVFLFFCVFVFEIIFILLFIMKFV